MTTDEPFNPQWGELPAPDSPAALIVLALSHFDEASPRLTGLSASRYLAGLHWMQTKSGARLYQVRRVWRSANKLWPDLDAVTWRAYLDSIADAFSVATN